MVERELASRRGSATPSSAAERRAARTRSRRRSSGAASAEQHDDARASQRGASRSGTPCSAVQMAFAWTSAPDIGCGAAAWVDVLQRRGRGADDHDRPRTAPDRRGREHVGERDGRDRAGRSAEVDQRAVAPNAVGGDGRRRRARSPRAASDG